MCIKLLWVRCRWLLSFLSLTLRRTIKDNESNQRVLTNSFDFNRLLKNIPRVETIQICDEALYSSQHSPAPFPRHIFVELMKMATFSVDFSFDDIMHHQIDKVAKGSPLGPALANIFVGYHKSKLFQTTFQPEIYYCYA